MMKRKTAVIFGIIIAAQLCLTPYAGVKVQAAELEEGQMFEDSSEDSETFGDVSIPDTQSAEKTEENEFGDDDGFSDGDVETFSAEDADQSCENMQELVLNVQDGEDITVKLNTLLAQARDKATEPIAKIFVAWPSPFVFSAYLSSAVIATLKGPAWSLSFFSKSCVSSLSLILRA